jgi:SAM-dependent methyltransferase
MSAVAKVSSWGEFERAGWESKVDPYHSFFGPISETISSPMLDAAGVQTGTRVLDLCCGPGYLAGAAARRGAVANGLDIAQAMVDRAAALYPTATFRAGDAEALPWSDATFDAVVCNFGIHHVNDPHAALAEIARVLRTHGRVVCSVWDEDHDELAVVPEAVYSADPAVPAEIPSPPAVPSYSTADEARPLLAAAGLTLRDITTISVAQRYDTAEQLWSGWLAAAIRTKPILDAQSDDVRQRARAAFDRSIADKTHNDGTVEISIAVHLVTASREDRTP